MNKNIVELDLTPLSDDEHNINLNYAYCTPNAKYTADVLITIITMQTHLNTCYILVKVTSSLLVKSVFSIFTFFIDPNQPHCTAFLNHES